MFRIVIDIEPADKTAKNVARLIGFYSMFSHSPIARFTQECIDAAHTLADVECIGTHYVCAFPDSEDAISLEDIGADSLNPSELGFYMAENGFPLPKSVLCESVSDSVSDSEKPVILPNHRFSAIGGLLDGLTGLQSDN